MTGQAIIMMEHEKEFSKEEFQDMCEEFLFQCLDEQYSASGHSFVCSIDLEKLFKKFEEKGFCEPKQKQIQYYLEPYWGRDSIRSKKLVAAIDRKDKDYNV
jgi:hypothetical protein